MKKRLIGVFALFTLIPIVALAHGFAGNGWANHMGFMGTDWGNHMGFMGGGWMMILWIGLLIFAIVAITRWTTGSTKNLAVTRDARSILAERYAKGEITQEEFREIKKQLK